MKESKHERFRRLAIARTNKIINMISLLKNLSNHSNYEYEKEEIEKIFSAIRESLDEAERAFYFDRKRKEVFKLEDDEDGNQFYDEQHESNYNTERRSEAEESEQTRADETENCRAFSEEEKRIDD